MSDQSFARLEQAFSQTDLEGPPGRLDGARENRGGLAVLLLHLKEDVNMNWKRVAEGLIWDFAYTLRKQQEAEARATEAAAEAGKWQQRHGELQQELAEQEVQTLALVLENRELLRNAGYGGVADSAPAELHLCGDPVMGCDAWLHIDRVEMLNGQPAPDWQQAIASGRATDAVRYIRASPAAPAPVAPPQRKEVARG